MNSKLQSLKQRLEALEAIARTLPKPDADGQAEEIDWNRISLATKKAILDSQPPWEWDPLAADPGIDWSLVPMTIQNELIDQLQHPNERS